MNCRDSAERRAAMQKKQGYASGKNQTCRNIQRLSGAKGSGNTGKQGSRSTGKQDNRNTVKQDSRNKGKQGGKNARNQGSRNTDKRGNRDINRHGVKGKRDIAAQISASQNFITKGSLIHRIIRLSGIGKGDTVFEIGTGKGHLTETLCRQAGYVHSIEIDPELCDTARERLQKCKNLQLICGDFLQYKLPAQGDYLVFANIPYCITTQIVEKLTGQVNPPRHIWLIMEKGAAKRFMGVPQETEKSLQMKVYWDSEIRYFFRRDDFHPMPSVDSVLVHFSLKKEPELNPDEYQAFCRFVKEGRKRGVCGKGGLLTNRQAQAALKRAGLPHAHEDGVTLYIQWLCLFRCWQTGQKQKR